MSKISLRETDGYMGTKCKYCSAVAFCDDDLAYHESSVHKDDLSDYVLVDSNFVLKDSAIARNQ